MDTTALLCLKHALSMYALDTALREHNLNCSMPCNTRIARFPYRHHLGLSDCRYRHVMLFLQANSNVVYMKSRLMNY